MMAAPFTKVTVHTVSDNANHFTVYVNDLEAVLAAVKSLNAKNAIEQLNNTHILALERALFIQQAIEEKIERSFL